MRKFQWYRIRAGDNYWELADRFKLQIHDIFAANPNVNPFDLYVGQKIRIPIGERDQPGERDVKRDKE
ncbi:LysM peptidoglycan-binding domain-containing protein [Thalassobacillus hwangdonensis]|uniref:LysM peptidoglycan-binding domain-containing protein n=1 Tax=Thalassobacillus hwangdonensis TaxID=546108 RepID=A0ABW3L1Z2_9BACI